VTTGATRCAKLQSNHHHQQTNIQHFAGRMPFLSPNQQCQSTEGKISHSMDLLTPSSSGGHQTFSLTTNSSWLPWKRVAMPLISHLMPVPHFSRYQNVPIWILLELSIMEWSWWWWKDDGGDNWSYKTCTAPVKSPSPTNQYSTFYRPDALPVAQPTMSKHWRENITFHRLVNPKLIWGSLNFLFDH